MREPRAVGTQLAPGRVGRVPVGKGAFQRCAWGPREAQVILPEGQRAGATAQAARPVG